MFDKVKKIKNRHYDLINAKALIFLQFFVLESTEN